MGSNNTYFGVRLQRQPTWRIHFVAKLNLIFLIVDNREEFSQTRQLQNASAFSGRPSRHELGVGKVQII